MDDFWKFLIVFVISLTFCATIILVPTHRYWSYHEDLKDKGFVYFIEPARETLVPIGENYAQPSQRCH